MTSLLVHTSFTHLKFSNPKLLQEVHDWAVRLGLEYAKTHPDTKIIDTADHGHASQIIDPPTSPDQPGAFSILRTKDGVEMTVSYATAPVGESQSHTGTEVRIAAQGPQAARVMGITNQTDLFFTMARALRLLPGQETNQ